MRNLTFLLGLLFMACSPADKVGEPYRGWKSGELDIHFIYTGRGEANFYIMPDATTMLIDAGDHQATVPMTDPKPDLSRRGGEWVARYIEMSIILCFHTSTTTIWARLHWMYP